MQQHYEELTGPPPEFDDDGDGGEEMAVVDCTITNLADAQVGSRMLVPTDDADIVAEAILRCARGAAFTSGPETHFALERRLLHWGGGADA